MTHGLSAPDERVLSIDPAYHGFGYVALETKPLRLVAWGTKRCRRSDGSTLRALRALVSRYSPTLLLIPDWRNVRHPLRARALSEFIESVAEVLADPNLPVRTVSTSDVASHFARVDARLKMDIAATLGRRFPELRRLVPRKRQVWDPEPRSLSVFDALGMALTRLGIMPRERS